MAKKHIFPLYLSGDKEVDTATWSGETSLIEVDNTNVTVGSAELPGTILSIVSTTASNSVITYTDAVSSDQNQIQINAVGESVVAMWTGSAWAVIGSVETVVAS